MSRPTSGVSFRSIPLLKAKILKVCILAILVCKVHKSHDVKNDTVFVNQFLKDITGENFKFISCLVLEISGRSLPSTYRKDENRVDLRRVNRILFSDYWQNLYVFQGPNSISVKL